jgi:hypothetical protein
MKGVIVQVGEPKSIVPFNSGKIAVIPTPAGCRGINTAKGEAK